MRGKAIPTKLKLLTGNPGKRAIKDVPEPELGIPVMPEWLKAFPVAVEEWNRVAVILNNMGIISDAEANLLATYCYLESEKQTMALEIQKEGRVAYSMKMDSLGNEVVDAKANPKAIQLKNLITEQRQIGSLLGLDWPSREKCSSGAGRGNGKFAGLIGANTGNK